MNLSGITFAKIAEFGAHVIIGIIIVVVSVTCIGTFLMYILLMSLL